MHEIECTIFPLNRCVYKIVKAVLNSCEWKCVMEYVAGERGGEKVCVKD